MGDEKITILEACKILHRSEKQVRRHIKTGRLQGEIGEDGKYYVLKSEVESMARHPDRMQVDKVAGHIERLDRRIAEIEKRLDSLSMHVDEIIEALYSMPTPPVAQPPPTTHREQTKPFVAHSGAIPEELPDDLVPFVDFYKQHHISESTARRTLEEHSESAISGERHIAGKTVKHVLNADGRHVFYEAFKGKASFRECPLCPH